MIKSVALCHCRLVFDRLVSTSKLPITGSAVRMFKPCVRQAHSTIPKLRMDQKEKTVTPMSLFLLLIPIGTFGLGTWQVQRRKWKLRLLEDLNSRTSATPQELPENLSELNALEYYPVHVRGHFDHSREMLVGPRSLIVDGDGASTGGLISQTQSNQSGFHVVTPFRVAGRDEWILVNRGWVPSQRRDPATRPEGQVEGEVEIVGAVRLDEQRKPFVPKNQPGNTWFYRDLPGMAARAGTEPVFLDALVSSTQPGGPVGGQTRVSLRNEHMSYLITWYGLSAITSAMWYRHFIRRMPLL